MAQENPGPIDAAIAALQQQRALLGDAVVDTALAALRAQRAAAPGEEAAEQQLRLVSVLFCDIVGSTSFGRQLDPEDLHQVLDGALARFSAIVREHQGLVLQYAGDSLLAVFGTPVSREDDAERALLAGLAILAEGRAQADAVHTRFGRTGFDVRVGVHTGPVLLGGGVDGAQTIRGMTVHVAARMEQTAPAGGLRISQDTARLVRGLFEMQRQPLLEIRGLDEPVDTWLVLGARPAAERRLLRGVEGLDTPLVGRGADLGALEAAYEAVRDGAQAPAFVTVIGEAGLGKSRLALEFGHWLARRPEGPRRLDATAFERDSGRPYGLLRMMFLRWLGILDSDAPAAARAQWLDGMAPLLRSRGDAAVLGHLVGLDFSDEPELRGLLTDARQLRDRAFFHAAQALRALAGGAAPLVVMLDDVHWADEGSLDFVDQVLATQARLRLLLVGFARPSLHERRPQWLGAAANACRVDLQPLDHAASTALAAALLHRLPDVPPALHALLTGAADGNPFCMEELVNMLIDQGVIATSPQGWQVQAARLPAVAVPGTLAGVLHARLDALPAQERQLLEAAAVVGVTFWDDALRALGVPSLAPLRALVGRDLVVEVGRSTLQGQREYRFRHHTLHQAVYGRLLKRFKRSAHARVAAWLSAQPGAVDERIADHHERAGEPARALVHLERAALDAQRRYANATALALIARAEALVTPQERSKRYALKLREVQVLALVSQPEACARALEELSALAEAMDDDGKRSEAAELSGRHLYDRGDAVGALRLALQAHDLAPRGEPALAGAACALAFWSLGRLGRYGEAAEHARRGLGFARLAGDRRIEAAILNQLGVHADDRGDIEGATGYYEQALALHRESGSQKHEADTLNNLAYIALGVGDYARAMEQLEIAREIFERIGRTQSAGVVLINLGLAQLNLGNASGARASADRALELLRRAGDRWAEAAALRTLGQAEAMLGLHAEADAHLQRALALFEQLGFEHLAQEVRAALGQAALAAGDAAGALGHADAILAWLRAGGTLDGTEEPMRVLHTCWQVLAAADDERAQGVLAMAHEALSARAGRLLPAHRRDYLERVPFHRDIVEAWHRWHASGAAIDP